MRRYLRRWQCHGNPFLCCQYIDGPRCNSLRDPHLLGYLVYLVYAVHAWLDARQDRA